jgi:ribosomal protein S18 acetylase RimI-like enzyme
MDMDLRRIQTSDPLHRLERLLRNEVLRKPLGMGPGTELSPHEDQAWHLVAVDAGEVVGCVLFHPDGVGGGRLFQMAVAATHQRQGLGTRLVRELERLLGKEGFREVRIHARRVATEFYRRLGYQVIGEPFTEVSIVHDMMWRDLGG